MRGGIGGGVRGVNAITGVIWCVHSGRASAGVELGGREGKGKDGGGLQ